MFQLLDPDAAHRRPKADVPIWTEYAGYAAVDSRAEAHRRGMGEGSSCESDLPLATLSAT